MLIKLENNVAKDGHDRTMTSKKNVLLIDSEHACYVGQAKNNNMIKIFKFN